MTAHLSPLVFLGVCIVATPIVWAISAMATTWWYEKCYLPRIAEGVA